MTTGRRRTRLDRFGPYAITIGTGVIIVIIYLVLARVDPIPGCSEAVEKCFTVRELLFGTGGFFAFFFGILGWFAAAVIAPSMFAELDARSSWLSRGIKSTGVCAAALAVLSAAILLVTMTGE